MKIHTLVFVTVLGILLPASTGWAQIDAVTRARHDLKLGFTIDGAIRQIYVKEGDRVNKGDLVMELDDEEGKYLIELYELRVASDLDLRSKEAALQLAKVEEEATRTVFDNDAGSPIEVERARIRTVLAAIEVELAKQTGIENVNQLNQAKERHARYLMLAPIAGVVDLMALEVGELVEKSKPVLRLVVIDPLWVDVPVPTDQTLKLKPGGPAWVTPQLPGSDQPIEGKIIHMAQVADAASDTRLVRVEIPNTKHMPAGGQVTVDFGHPSGTASAEAR